jgi:uncharacterized membrane protein
MRVDSRRLLAASLAGLLATAGVTHFIAPGFYEPLIPHGLPESARTWVLGSGAVELACALLVARRRTRHLGATLAAVLFVLVFPGNVKMALDWRHDGVVKATAAWARLPLQIPLVLWALRVRRQSADVPAPVLASSGS